MHPGFYVLKKVQQASVLVNQPLKVYVLITTC